MPGGPTSDYRRIVRVLDLLAPGVPVLCCTATANNRVVGDVVAQLGSVLAPVRGPLGRDGLRLEVIEMPRQDERIAWLADTIPRLPGTGIVYCLTVHDTERVAAWLESKGIMAAAYTGGTDSDLRPEIEEALLANELKVVVATSALGMGFDKPDLSFVIHYQAPGSPIAYYQQVGRAGRALSSSRGILMCGVEDRDIQDYFIQSAFPEPHLTRQVVDLLERRAEPTSPAAILDEVNLRPGQLELVLKMLEVEGHLDDRDAEPCGICDNCMGQGLRLDLGPEQVQEAIAFLRNTPLTIEPRQQDPHRRRLAPDLLLQPGRALALWGDGGWGSLIRRGKYDDVHFADELVDAAARLVTDWEPSTVRSRSADRSRPVPCCCSTTSSTRGGPSRSWAKRC